MAQTETTTVSQDELSAILSGKADSVIIPEQDKPEEKKEDKKPEAFKKVVNTEFSWSEIEKLTDKPEDEEETKEDVVEPNEGETKKPGRKVSDLVSMVNDLVEAGDLKPFDDGPAKTIEEARELIKLNLEQTKNSTVDDIWQDKVKKYSPQVQAILHYAEGGGTDVTPLLSAIAEVERTTNLDLNTEEGQESIISEFLKVSGWPEEDIKEEIETTKDLGKLKTKAEKFLPKLEQMNQQRIQAMMAEQEQRQIENEEARKKYLSTIKNTLDKDVLGEIKLTRQDKALVWDGLTDIRYTSWSGQPTNLFFKKLEEMQAGDKADYDHFLEIVYHTLNRGAFKDKLKNEIKNTETANTVRKLKIGEQKNASTSEGFDEIDPKKVVKRQGFRNPWS